MAMAVLGAPQDPGQEKLEKIKNLEYSAGGGIITFDAKTYE
jgi:hypothetical protein